MWRGERGGEGVEGGRRVEREREQHGGWAERVERERSYTYIVRMMTMSTNVITIEYCDSRFLRSVMSQYLQCAAGREGRV